MKITSHFIGIKLRNDSLVDLYVNLQKTLGPYKDILEFQNILSAHITLYYLSAEITESDLGKIKKLLSGFPKLFVNLESFSYFGGQESPQLCYLSPVDPSGEFSRLNEVLRQNFPMHSSIPENLLNYIPHMTLFKIRDSEKFLELRSELEEILQGELHRIGQLNLFDSFGIFKVNSELKPEIQIAL